jgi:hypothetical protein
MRLFFRSSVAPDEVMSAADDFFGALGMTTTAREDRSRTLAGPLGNLLLTVRMEGGHYTFVEAHTDQIGESRLDKNVKKFFLRLHRTADPSHRPEASY